MTTNVNERPARRARLRKAGPPLALVAALAPTSELHAAPTGSNYEGLHVLELGHKGDLGAPARAVTQAVKRRVREAADYTLANSDLPFDAFASMCHKGPLVGPDNVPREPAARCLDQVGASLHGDSFLPKAPYVWGVVYRPSGSAGLAVRLHLWRPGKGDASAEERLDAVPADENDAALDAAAERLLARLLYGDRAGFVRLVAGRPVEGDVFVDGRARGALENAPRLFAMELGERSIEVRERTRVVARGRAQVRPGEQDVALALPERLPSPGPGGTPPASGSDGAWQTPVGWVGLGLGAGLLGAGVFSSLKVGGLDDRAAEPAYSNYRSSVSGGQDPCDAAGAGRPSSAPDSVSPQRFDDLCSQASTFRALQYVFYGAGALSAAAGAYLVLSAPAAAPAAASGARWRVRPTAGLAGGGLTLDARF